MPLLRGGRPQVRTDGKKQRSIGIRQSIRRKAFRERAEAGNRTIIRAQSRIRRRQKTWNRVRLSHEEWRIESGAGIRIRSIFVAAVENAISRAHYQFVGNLVSDAEARREVGRVGRNQATRRSPLNRDIRSKEWREGCCLSGGNDQRGGGEIEVRLLVSPGLHRGE